MTSIIAKSFGPNTAMLAVESGGYTNGIMSNDFCKLHTFKNKVNEVIIACMGDASIGIEFIYDFNDSFSDELAFNPYGVRTDLHRLVKGFQERMKLYPEDKEEHWSTLVVMVKTDDNIKLYQITAINVMQYDMRLQQNELLTFGSADGTIKAYLNGCMDTALKQGKIISPELFEVYLSRAIKYTNTRGFCTSNSFDSYLVELLDPSLD